MLLNQNHRLLSQPYQVRDELDHKQDLDIVENEHIQYVEDKPEVKYLDKKNN